MMSSDVLILDATSASIRRAAETLRAGGLVALPTETVYGLAADASNVAAVSQVFSVKGRPADHPLIVHLSKEMDLGDWAQDVPEDAYRLAGALWPGPLTLVLKRHRSVLTVVTGGLETIAVRVPAHPVAQRLIEEFGRGVAAPSANRFGRVSPTSAHDVACDLGEEVDLIIDGGPCEIGVESTIVEFGDSEVSILRHGAISVEVLERVLGRRVRVALDGPRRAPGMSQSHYAPATPLELCDQDEVSWRAGEYVSMGLRVGVVSTRSVEVAGTVALWHAAGDVVTFARSLYRWLRQADAAELDVVVVTLPPDEGLGVAVRDRLQRAAHRSE